MGLRAGVAVRRDGDIRARVMDVERWAELNELFEAALAHEAGAAVVVVVVVVELL